MIIQRAGQHAGRPSDIEGRGAGKALLNKQRSRCVKNELSAVIDSGLGCQTCHCGPLTKQTIVWLLRELPDLSTDYCCQRRGLRLSPGHKIGAGEQSRPLISRRIRLSKNRRDGFASDPVYLEQVRPKTSMCEVKLALPSGLALSEYFCATCCSTSGVIRDFSQGRCIRFRRNWSRFSKRSGRM